MILQRESPHRLWLHYHHGFLTRDHLCCSDRSQAPVPLCCVYTAWTRFYNVGLIQGLTRRLVWMAPYHEYISVNNGCTRVWGGSYDRGGAGGRGGGGLRDDLTQRCSINPIHNCFPTWCAVLLHEGVKPRVL